jgi:hypothetical protein
MHYRIWSNKSLRKEFQRMATGKSNHLTVVTNFAKSSKRINTFLREMSDAKHYTV